jgi:hypothetical protein
MTDLLERTNAPTAEVVSLEPDRPRRPADPRRLGVGAVVAGAAAMVAGMAIDGVQHALDETLVEREGLFTLTNLGHALLLLGAGVVVVGILLALFGRSLYRTPDGRLPSPGRRALQLTAPLALLAILVGVAVWGSNSSLAQGHPAGDHHDAGLAAGGEATPHDHSGAAASGDHAHATVPYQPLDQAAQAQLISQMEVVRDITMRYPTVADATAAGMRPVGRFSAGSGAHYLVPLDTSVLGSLREFDLERPIIYLYSGNEPTSTVVGVMYYLMTADAPEGFAGPNDVWHLHTGLCLKYSATGIDLPLPVDGDVTSDQCSAVGDAMFMDVTGYMIHVWSGSGWESPAGIFAHDNPALTCADGRTAGEVELHEGCAGR